MSADIITWIVGIAYLAIGIACAIVYGWDSHAEEDETSEAIRSLMRIRTKSDREIAVGVIILIALFWPVWFPIYWFGGSEEREAAKALEKYRLKHPELQTPAESKEEASQPPETTHGR